MFYGDSITETWRGTDMGRACRRCRGVPAVFGKYFGKYSTAVLAVGGARAGSSCCACPAEQVCVAGLQGFLLICNRDMIARHAYMLACSLKVHMELDGLL